MPTVPRYGNRQVEEAPLPGVRLNSSAPVEAFGGGAAAQPIDLSGPQQLATQIWKEERDKANQVALTDASARLSATATQLLTDAQQRRGKDAFDAPDIVTDGWKKSVEEIRKGLSNEAQRLAFDNRVTSEWVGIDRQLQRHVAGERQAYDNAATESFVQNTTDKAVANYTDPELVAVSAAEVGAARRDWGRRNGVPPEEVARRVAEDTSRVHVGIIARMHANGEDIPARDYYEAHKAEFTGADLTAVEQRVNTASSDGEGERIAAEIWATMGPKGTYDPVKVATLEDEARKRGGDVGIAKAAIASLQERARSWNFQQTELTASNKATVLGAANEGASLAQVKRMPEYLALDGASQEQLVRYLTKPEGRENHEPTPAQWASYWGLSNPVALSQMSESHILSLVPSIGQGLTNKLIEQRRSLDKPEKIFEAKIDNDLFSAKAEDAGFDPLQKKTKATKESRQQLGQLRDEVLGEISRQQQIKGRPLARDEKEEVMQKLIDKKVMLDISYRGDRERIAATLNVPEREQAYVPKDDAGTEEWGKVEKNFQKNWDTTKRGRPFNQRDIERAVAALRLGDNTLYKKIRDGQ